MAARPSKPRKPARKSSKKSAKRSTRKVARKSATRPVKRPALRKPTRKVPRKAAPRTVKRPTRPNRSAPGESPPLRLRISVTPHHKPLRIALFGAGGMIGSKIAQEALDRGHKVTGIQRNPGSVLIKHDHLDMVQGDATDARSVHHLAKGHDAIVSAISPRGAGSQGRQAKAARALLQGARASGVRRLVVVGGAGSLEVAPGVRLIDTPEFPAEYKPEGMEHVNALEVYRLEGDGVDWTFVSPAAMIQPGKRKGKYQSGGDQLLVGRDGQSQISVEDYAVAFVDELEQGAYLGRRMSVAWP